MTALPSAVGLQSRGREDVSILRSAPSREMMGSMMLFRTG
jgi:hypothetical protein